MDYITQEEYLLFLSDELKYLSPKDATKVLNYYQTKINNALDEGQKELDIIKSLPDPKKVAENAYNSHGVKYLEIRKRKLKVKNVFDKITNSILLFLCLCAFGLVMFFILRNIINTFMIIKYFISFDSVLDKIISSLLSVAISISLIIASIYVIDLFYILMTHFLNVIIKVKDTDKKRKILNFTITNFLEEKTKKPHIISKTLFCFLGASLILAISSYAIKGYVYTSINDKTLKTDLLTLNIEGIKQLNIDASNVKINIYNSDEFYITYQYTFKHPLNIETINNNINIKMESSFDKGFLNLLNEPTQVINIYMPNNRINFSANFSKGNFTVKDVTISNVEINTSLQAELVFVNSKINTLNAKGYDQRLGISNSISNNLESSSYKGQLVIEENSLIDYMKINNQTGKVKLSSSTILEADFINESGSINIQDLRGNNFNLETHTSKTYFVDCIYDKMNFEILDTALVDLTRVVSKDITTNMSNSYFTLNYVKAYSLNITAKFSNIFINDLGATYHKEDQIYEYNNYDYITNAEITNEGKTSKTDIGTSNFENLKLTQNKGYIVILDSYLKESTIVANGAEMSELSNIDGINMDLYLLQIGDYFEITNDHEVDLRIVVKRFDEISYACLIKGKNVNLTFEQGDDNE